MTFYGRQLFCALKITFSIPLISSNEEIDFLATLAVKPHYPHPFFSPRNTIWVLGAGADIMSRRV